MALYARPSWMLARQITGDAFVLAWTVGWWLTGRSVDGMIRELAGPARAIATASEAMQDGFASAAQTAESAPWAGPVLRQPFDAATSGLQQIIDSAHEQVVGIEQVATAIGWLMFLVPVLLVLAVWLPQRIRFVLDSAAAARFIDAQPDLDLLALRAMATRPFHQLARISDDPLSAWRARDQAVIDALADLELRRNGWTRPAIPPRVVLEASAVAPRSEPNALGSAEVAPASVASPSEPTPPPGRP